MEKKFELENRVTKLENKIDEMAGKINVDVSEQRLKQKADDLSDLEKKLKAQKLKVKTSTTKLNGIIEERRKLFLQTIETVNKGMSEFCEKFLNNNFIGRLKYSAESDEPYLGETSFSWSNAENPNRTISEFEPSNHLAALTLMWGILRFKQQKFVIFNDVCKKIYENLDQYFSEQQELQIISFTSKIQDDHSTYLIRPDPKSPNTFKIRRN